MKSELKQNVISLRKMSAKTATVLQI